MPYKPSEIRAFKESLDSTNTKKLPKLVDKAGKSFLPLKAIKTDVNVFQPRNESWDIESHVTELTIALKKGKHLHPITVTTFNNQWYCIDGHQRLKAYTRYAKSKGKQCDIPVVVKDFETVDDAILFSYRANKNDKLPLSREEKREATWFFAKQLLPFKDVEHLIDRKRTSYQWMLKLVKQLNEKKMFEEDMPYRKAMAIYHGTLDEDDGTINDYDIEKQADDFRAKMSKAMGKAPSRNLQAFERALETYLGGRYKQLLSIMVNNNFELTEELLQDFKDDIDNYEDVGF